MAKSIQNNRKVYDSTIEMNQDFTGDNHSSGFFKFKEQIMGQADANDRKNVKIIVPVKYLRKF